MKLRSLALIAGSLSALSVAHAGKIVVDNDEWVTSDVGFATAPDAADFVLNLASWFSDGGPGNFLAYSSNFSLTGGSLASTLTGGGHSFLASTAVAFDLPTLLGYDGVFLAGNPASTSVLIDYVNAGGNVLLLGGTAFGVDAAAEEALWAPFLNAFNLDYSSPYNGIEGNIPISSGHPIFAGVSELYQNNGNSVSEIDPSNPLTTVLVSQDGQGLIAVYDSQAMIPEPGTFVAGGIAAALLGLGGLYRRSKTTIPASV